MYKRIFDFSDLKKESCFFWGPRQTGKSTLLKNIFPQSHYYDLLLSDEYLRLATKPSLFRDEVLSLKGNYPVIVDEIQKIPILLDEVQWLMVNHRKKFILCGSSTRKIIRSGANLLGGRALRYELFPLVFSEIPDFDIFRALTHGLLPNHYVSERPADLLKSYIGHYVREEISHEAALKNIPLFGRFLEIAALCNGEVINFSNISRECGVSSPTVAEYFRLLTDTLMGRFLPSFQKRPKRRIIQAPKFYFFDIGIVNGILNRKTIDFPGEIFGKAFESFIFQELTAHSAYSGIDYPISYWRTTSGNEVDFILGQHEVALEVKSTREVVSHHLKGLRSFPDEYSTKRLIAVSMDKNPRKSGKIEILPWNVFLKELWEGNII